MTDPEWVTTAEAGRRLGYLTPWYLVKRLEELSIPCWRITPRSPRHWHWPTIVARVLPRDTVAKDCQPSPTDDEVA